MSPKINAATQRWNMTPSAPIPPNSSILPGLSMRAEGMVQEYLDRQQAPEIREWIHQQREQYPSHWTIPQRKQGARLDLTGWQMDGRMPPNISRRQSAALILWHLRQQERAALAFSSEGVGRCVPGAIEQPDGVVVPPKMGSPAGKRVEYNRL